MTLERTGRTSWPRRGVNRPLRLSFSDGGGAMVGDASANVPEAARLENLWAGGFGDAYSKRNSTAGTGRNVFWEVVLSKYPVRRVLEVGCNAGANLRWIAPHLAPGETYGVDINHEALAQLRDRVPNVNAVASTARELPFRDGWFDLCFTTGVLIHQPESTLALVMGEVVRVSRRFVLCGEYFAPKTIEVPYRGMQGALFKRDYGSLYRELFPELRLIDEGSLGQAEGWDDITWWLFEKS
jgi:pseudaminic acid biosynthesis-associated methylase